MSEAYAAWKKYKEEAAQRHIGNLPLLVVFIRTDRSVVATFDEDARLASSLCLHADYVPQLLDEGTSEECEAEFRFALAHAIRVGNVLLKHAYPIAFYDLTEVVEEVVL